MDDKWNGFELLDCDFAQWYFVRQCHAENDDEGGSEGITS